MASERLYGIGEPLLVREKDTRVKAAEYLRLVKAMGCNAWRCWMHLTELLKDPETPDRDEVARYTAALDTAVAIDIEVTGMSHLWFLPEGCKEEKGDAVPARDLTAGSAYIRFLEMLETSWHTLVSCFPQVPMWEVGNEWNLDIFLHPDGFRESKERKGFSQDEKMDIAVDMMYFSAKGIRRANPKAKVVSFSPCISVRGGDLPYYLPPQYGIAQALDRVYSRIKSRKFWSDNTDDYFDLLAWHPYLMHIGPVDVESEGTARAFLLEPGNLWKDGNDAAYGVMCQYGDGHKQVLITEFGFTDCGLPDKVQEQAELTRKTFEMFAEMPYIRTVHAFRLLEDSSMLERNTDMRIGGLSEVYFGMFREPKNGCAPKAKALVIQQMAGGMEDLAKVGRSVAATVG